MLFHRVSSRGGEQTEFGALYPYSLMVIACKLFQPEPKRFNVGKIFRGAHAIEYVFYKKYGIAARKKC
jgi:hypothetical protein